MGSVGLAGVLVALWYPWSDPVPQVADLLVGLAFLLLAVLALPRSRPLAVLCATVALTWWVGSVWSGAVFWHRGPLVHLLLVFPSVWPPVAWVRGAVVVGYAVSAVPLVWSTEAAAIGLAAALVLGRMGHSARMAGGRAAHRIPAAVATALVAVAVMGDAVARSVVPLGAAVRPSFVVFCLALAAAAGILGASLRRSNTEQMADLVVELGERGGGGLRGQLAQALDDPGLQLAVERDGIFIDEAGAVVVPPAPGDPRRGVVIERAGGSAVLVVHHASAQDEPALREAVDRWVAMSRANAELRDRTRASIEQVAASRRRLLMAADAERERLAGQIGESVTEPLRTLGERLATSPQVDELLAIRLGAAVDRLDRAADGLAPAGLQEGLAAALGELGTTAPLAVTLDVVDLRIDPAVERAAFYVCAEALANAVKHSGASGAHIRVVAEDGSLRLEVGDDGRGGAASHPGSGLSGLADRVAALGGTLAVDSPPGSGTTVRAILPL